MEKKTRKEKKKNIFAETLNAIKTTINQ